jgi:hypothetical protein
MGTDFPPVSYTLRNFNRPIALLVTCFHAGFLPGFYFNPEAGGYIFLRNVG